MVMIKDRNGNDAFHLDQGIYNVLLRNKQKINEEDQEVWWCFQGDTGSGKSVRAQQFGYVVDPTINLNRICFDKDEFIRAVINAEKGQVIIADEGIAIFFSRGSMTKEGRLIAELSAQIRQKNLCIFICIPDILNVDSSIQKKLLGVVNVYENRGDRGNGIVTLKGNIRLFLERPTSKKVTNLINYLKIKRSNPAFAKRKPKPDFIQKGDSVSKKPFYPVNEEDYRNKKESVLKKYIKKDEDNIEDIKNKKEDNINKKMVIKFLSEKNPKLTDVAISNLCDCTRVYTNLVRNDKC